MLLDRIFGMLAAIAFVAGAIGHFELLIGRQAEANVLDIPYGVFLASLLAAVVYLVAYVGRRDHLEYNDDGELALGPLMKRLPGWARMITVAATVYTVVLMALFVYWLVSDRPLYTGNLQDLAATEQRIRANAIVLAITAGFANLSFLIASYLLLRPRADAS